MLCDSVMCCMEEEDDRTKAGLNLNGWVGGRGWVLQDCIILNTMKVPRVF